MTLTKAVPPTENSGTGNNVCQAEHVWVHPVVGWPSVASAEDAPFRLNNVVRNWLTGVSGVRRGLRCDGGLDRERGGCAQILPRLSI